MADNESGREKEKKVEESRVRVKRKEYEDREGVRRSQEE